MAYQLHSTVSALKKEHNYFAENTKVTHINDCSIGIIYPKYQPVTCMDDALVTHLCILLTYHCNDMKMKRY